MGVLEMEGRIEKRMIKGEIKRRRFVDWIKRKYHKNMFFFFVSTTCLLIVGPSSFSVIFTYTALTFKLIQLLAFYLQSKTICYLAHAFANLFIFINFCIMLNH